MTSALSDDVHYILGVQAKDFCPRPTAIPLDVNDSCLGHSLRFFVIIGEAASHAQY